MLSAREEGLWSETMREGTAVYECDFVETEGKWLKKDGFYAEDKTLQLKDTFQAHDRASNVGQTRLGNGKVLQPTQ
jgi:hypothetical protein